MSKPLAGTPITVVGAGGVTTVTISNVVVASGESLLTLVGIGDGSGLGSDRVTSVVRNSEGQTNKWFKDDANWTSSHGFFIQSPSTGTFNTVVTLSGAWAQVGCHSIPISGVSGVGTPVTNSGLAITSLSAGALSPGLEDIIIGHIMSDDDLTVAPTTPGGYEIADSGQISADTSSTVQKVVNTDSGSINMSWSQSSNGASCGAMVIQGSGSRGPMVPVGSKRMRRRSRIH